MKRVALCLAPLLAGVACTDYTHSLPGGYYFYSEGQADQVIVSESWRRGDPFIPCTVEKYVIDDDLVLVRQRSVDACFWESSVEYDTPVGEVRYWIVQASKGRIDGPLVLEEFLSRAEELGAEKSKTRKVLQ